MQELEELNYFPRRAEELGKQDLSDTTNTSSGGLEQPRRRVRNSAGQRFFICGCGKTYLSYPAIYTHVKNKHGGLYPDGSVVPKTNGAARDAADLARIGKSASSMGAKSGEAPGLEDPSAFDRLAAGLLRQMGVSSSFVGVGLGDVAGCDGPGHSAGHLSN